MSITHAKVSAKTDSADTTLVRPSDWNADHLGNGLGIFNPVDYGAVYDGVTDDTTAHQNAINAAAVDGGIVQCPPGDTKVTSLAVKSHVEIRGAGARSTIFHGTAGSDIFALPATGAATYIGIIGLGTNGGRRGVAYATGGAGDYATNIILRNLEISSPSAECIYTEGAIEEWYLDDLRLNFGTYGFRHANVATTGGNGMDKITFRNVTCGVQSINGFRIELNISNSVLWEDLNIIGSAQHGFYADGGIRSWVFVNPSTESNGNSGKNNRTTGSITTGTPTLTVASATGLVIGDPITVEEANVSAGTAGDLTTTITNVVGTTITLAANAAQTVTGVNVTNASYDDFFFAQTINYGSNVTFIGGVIGDTGGGLGGGLRYAINSTGLVNLNCFGVGTSGLIPIYMSRSAGVMLSPEATVRYPGSRTNTFGGDVFRSFAVGTTAGQSRTQLPSSPGGNILLALRDNVGNASGTTFGKLEVRKSDGYTGPHTLLFSVDGQTGYAALASTILATGTGSPESAVTAPVGSLFLRTDGSTSTTLYVKTSGSGNTGWTAK